MDIPISIEFGAEIATNLIAKAFKGVKEWRTGHDTFPEATHKYITGLLERNSTIKVLTMREPQSLEKLYVRANILKDKITAEQGLSAAELESFFKRDGRGFGKTAETVDGELMMNKLPRFIVLGKPGAGKTTYLRYLTLMMLHPNSQIQQRRLPIFVTLREWADKKVPLLNFIAEQFDICGFKNAQPFVERVLASGDCLVLFDGLDEVSQDANQSGIIQEIKDFSDKYIDNQFIISCRVAAYNRWFDRFTDVEMADFNEEQIEKFIQNWFHDEPKTGQECWQKLQNSPQLKELASVPLLLTLLCIVYNRSNNFPPNRANLYEEAIDALLRDWDATRRITRDEVYQQLSITRKRSMFARIAWETFTENMYFVPERVLTKQIEKYIEHLPGFKLEELDLDSQVVLKSIEAQHGIFVERAKRVHSFAHLTFQEYFTAKYIVDNARDGTLETLVNEHLYDDKWREVFLLVAGMLDSADEFLLLMQRKNNEILNSKEINALLHVVGDALLPEESELLIQFKDRLNIESKWLLIARKTVGVCIAGNYRSPLFNILITEGAKLNDNARAYLAGYYIRHIITFDFDRNVLFSALASNMESEIASIFGLDFNKLEVFVTENKITIGSETSNTTSAFLIGNAWTVKCLQSDAFVSKPIREKIMNEMLKPKAKEN